MLKNPTATLTAISCWAPSAGQNCIYKPAAAHSFITGATGLANDLILNLLFLFFLLCRTFPGQTGRICTYLPANCPPNRTMPLVLSGKESRRCMGIFMPDRIPKRTLLLKQKSSQTFRLTAGRCAPIVL